MSEYHWKTVSVVAFDELMQELDRADRKGCMPDAVKEAWEAFNWKPEQPAQQPRPWQGLTEDEINKLAHTFDWTAAWSAGRFAYKLERVLKEKNT